VQPLHFMSFHTVGRKWRNSGSDGDVIGCKTVGTVRQTAVLRPHILDSGNDE
jgi:hypothetical protein